MRLCVQSTLVRTCMSTCGNKRSVCAGGVWNGVGLAEGAAPGLFVWVASTGGPYAPVYHSAVTSAISCLPGPYISAPLPWSQGARARARLLGFRWGPKHSCTGGEDWGARNCGVAVQKPAGNSSCCAVWGAAGYSHSRSCTGCYCTYWLQQEATWHGQPQWLNHHPLLVYWCTHCICVHPYMYQSCKIHAHFMHTYVLTTRSFNCYF